MKLLLLLLLFFIPQVVKIPGVKNYKSYYYYYYYTICLLLLQPFCVSPANSAVITHDAALNRPAYQSSVAKNTYGRYPPTLANDGNRETRSVVGGVPQCSISATETNPWWAVNLGHRAAVYRVDLTNRGDGSGMKKYKLVRVYH